MTTLNEPGAGFFATVHRSLSEPVLLAGAPRTVAIANGTLAAAIGLGLRLWIPGILLWALGHAAAVWAAMPNSSMSCGVTCAIRRISGCEQP